VISNHKKIKQNSNMYI